MRRWSKSYLQQSDRTVLLDAYGATIHDKTFVPNKPARPVDFKQFTVPQRGEGIVPARMLCAGGFNQVRPSVELGLPDYWSRELTRWP